MSYRLLTGQDLPTIEREGVINAMGVLVCYAPVPMRLLDNREQWLDALARAIATYAGWQARQDLSARAGELADALRPDLTAAVADICPGAVWYRQETDDPHPEAVSQLRRSEGESFADFRDRANVLAKQEWERRRR